MGILPSASSWIDECITVSLLLSKEAVVGGCRYQSFQYSLIDRVLTSFAYRWNIIKNLAEQNWISSEAIESFYPDLEKTYPDLPALPYPSFIVEGHLFPSPDDIIEWISRQEEEEEEDEEEEVK